MLFAYRHKSKGVRASAARRGVCDLVGFGKRCETHGKFCARWAGGAQEVRQLGTQEAKRRIVYLTKGERKIYNESINVKKKGRKMVKIRQYLRPNAIRMAFGLTLKVVGTIAELLLPLLLTGMTGFWECFIFLITKNILSKPCCRACRTVLRL